jgi:hypothetical protein
MNIKAPHYHEKEFSPYKLHPLGAGPGFEKQDWAVSFFMVVGCFYILYY